MAMGSKLRPYKLKLFQQNKCIIDIILTFNNTWEQMPLLSSPSVLYLFSRLLLFDFQFSSEMHSISREFLPHPLNVRILAQNLPPVYISFHILNNTCGLSHQKWIRNQVSNFVPCVALQGKRKWGKGDGTKLSHQACRKWIQSNFLFSWSV